MEITNFIENYCIPTCEQYGFGDVDINKFHYSISEGGDQYDGLAFEFDAAQNISTKHDDETIVYITEWLMNDVKNEKFISLMSDYPVDVLSRNFIEYSGFSHGRNKQFIEGYILNLEIYWDEINEEFDVEFSESEKDEIYNQIEKNLEQFWKGLCNLFYSKVRENIN